jgi:hypothetical protein
MDRIVQHLASPLAGSNNGIIEPAGRRACQIGSSIVAWFIKRLFYLRGSHGFVCWQPSAAVVQEVVAKRRGSRTATVIAVAFGIISLDTSSAVAGQCADAIQRIEAALDELTANPDTSAVHQSLRAQMHRQPNPRSVARGQEQAIADEQHHRAALERARAADANHDEAGCMKALPDLRHELIIR